MNEFESLKPIVLLVVLHAAFTFCIRWTVWICAAVRHQARNRGENIKRMREDCGAKAAHAQFYTMDYSKL